MSAVSWLARYRAVVAVAAALAALGGVALLSTPPRHESAPGGAGPAATAAPPVDPRTVPRPSSAARAIDALLAARSAALLRRDEAAFMATVDPRADQRFRQAQRALFGNLAEVSLREWSYHVQPDDQVDVTTVDVAGADELLAPDVRLRYALDGVDTVATERPTGYLFVRRGAAWYVRSDDQLAALGRVNWRGPWDFGPCRVITTDGGIVLFHPGSEAMARRVADELGPAVAAVTAVWGGDWARRVAVVLPATTEEMRAFVGPDFPVDAVAAVAVADRVDTNRHTAQGQRVVLSPTEGASLSGQALRIVLRHEITHVATRAHTVDGSPLWLLEGFADYVGYRDSGVPLATAAPGLAARVLTSGPPETLPSDADFLAGGAAIDLGYQQSYSLALFIGQRLGEATLVELYRRLAALGPALGERVDAVLRDVVRLDRAELVAGWQEYLRETLD